MSARIAVAIGFALLMSGCDPGRELRYYDGGPGTDVVNSSIDTATAQQSNYLHHLCGQLGLASTSDTSIETGDCATTKYPGRVWPLIVQAGMNDIDARCDDFLAWVDNHRRNDKHWTKQIGDTILATDAILRATNSSRLSIDIVAASLGLANNTFANSTGRLLTTADQTTVQSVVLSEQQRYRDEINAIGSRIDNRPAAIHALRSYLRICLPMTIEARINSTVTIYERAGTSGLTTKKELISAKSIKSLLVIQDSERPLPDPLYIPRSNTPDRLNDNEQLLTVPQIKKYQKLLCVKDSGKIDTTTRGAVFAFLSGLKAKDDSLFPNKSEEDKIEITNVVTPRVGKFLRAASDEGPECSKTTFKNPFEVGRYGGVPDAAKKNIVEFQGMLKAALTNAGTSDAIIGSTGEFDANTRSGIKKFRDATSAKLPGDFNTHLDARLDVAIRKKAAGQ